MSDHETGIVKIIFPVLKIFVDLTEEFSSESKVYHWWTTFKDCFYSQKIIIARREDDYMTIDEGKKFVRKLIAEFNKRLNQLKNITIQP